jgi:hypothetical protein
VAGDPARTELGTVALMAGEGLLTVRSTAVPAPRVALPFSAITDSNPPWASYAADTSVDTCVLLRWVVFSTTPPTWTAVLEVKPFPVTVMVVVAAPAVTEAGETDATVGAAAAGGVGVFPELPEPPPLQPAMKLTGRQRQTQREEARNRVFIETIEYVRNPDSADDFFSATTARLSSGRKYRSLTIYGPFTGQRFEVRDIPIPGKGKTDQGRCL